MNIIIMANELKGLTAVLGRPGLFKTDGSFVRDLILLIVWNIGGNVNYMVGERGLEPPILSEHGSKPCAYAIPPLAHKAILF